MPKCPNCGKEVDHLEYHETKDCESEVNLIDGKLVHSNESSQSDNKGYICPLCFENVCMADEDAIEFLKGG